MSSLEALDGFCIADDVVEVYWAVLLDPADRSCSVSQSIYWIHNVLRCLQLRRDKWLGGHGSHQTLVYFLGDNQQR